jgi:hypothetical protein
MTHPYKHYLICRDNYFEDPTAVVELSKSLNYSRSTYFPGKRTGNLLGFDEPAIKNFADWFANRISYDVFPGISMYELYLCFHINEPCADQRFNKGWIHNDYGNLAGLVYLTAGEEDINTGTSIFASENNSTDANELPTDTVAMKEFYLNDKITPEFIAGFENNKQTFESRETIRIGNKFNRLIAYDSKMWHRPNSFSTKANLPRLALLFFVSQFNYQ